MRTVHTNYTCVGVEGVNKKNQSIICQPFLLEYTRQYLYVGMLSEYFILLVYKNKIQNNFRTQHKTLYKALI